MAHTSIKSRNKDIWYFDSGCSKHMKHIWSLMMIVRTYSTSCVTFGDGSKGRIRGVGVLKNIVGPNQKDVLLVKGVTTKLISTSQLCDQGYTINFSKTECIVSNMKSNLVMKGIRTDEDCYMWVPLGINNSCLKKKESHLIDGQIRINYTEYREVAGEMSQHYKEKLKSRIQCLSSSPSLPTTTLTRESVPMSQNVGFNITIKNFKVPIRKLDVDTNKGLLQLKSR